MDANMISQSSYNNERETRKSKAIVVLYFDWRGPTFDLNKNKYM